MKPWRSIDVARSSTMRASGWAASRAVRSSIRPTVWITRPAISSGTGVLNGRHGVSTSSEPANPDATCGSSSYVPTARVSTPSQVESSASRGRPRP